MRVSKTLEYVLKKWPSNSRITDIPNTTREDLALLFKELGFTKGVEVGVAKGEFSEVLCKSNPDLKLYCVDSWTAYKGYVDNPNQEVLDEYYESAKKRLKPYNVEIIKGFSHDAVRTFKDESTDFIFLDGNHSLSHVIFDIVEWSKKVKSGGIISGHDYIKSNKYTSTMHVVEAVNAYIESYKVSHLFILGSKDLKEGEKRDKTRSWFFVKR